MTLFSKRTVFVDIHRLESYVKKNEDTLYRFCKIYSPSIINRAITPGKSMCNDIYDVRDLGISNSPLSFLRTMDIVSFLKLILEEAYYASIEQECIRVVNVDDSMRVSSLPAVYLPFLTKDVEKSDSLLLEPWRNYWIGSVSVPTDTDSLRDYYIDLSPLFDDNIVQVIGDPAVCEYFFPRWIQGNTTEIYAFNIRVLNKKLSQEILLHFKWITLSSPSLSERIVEIRGYSRGLITEIFDWARSVGAFEIMADESLVEFNVERAVVVTPSLEKFQKVFEILKSSYFDFIDFKENIQIDEHTKQIIQESLPVTPIGSNFYGIVVTRVNAFNVLANIFTEWKLLEDVYPMSSDNKIFTENTCLFSPNSNISNAVILRLWPNKSLYPIPSNPIDLVDFVSKLYVDVTHSETLSSFLCRGVTALIEESDRPTTSSEIRGYLGKWFMDHNPNLPILLK